MAQQIPANQKLWSTLVAQAKARYHVWPNPSAAAWVHQQYVRMGGKFVGSTKDIDPRFRDDKKKKQQKRHHDTAKHDDKEER